MIPTSQILNKQSHQALFKIKLLPENQEDRALLKKASQAECSPQENEQLDLYIRKAVQPYEPLEILDLLNSRGEATVIATIL